MNSVTHEDKLKIVHKTLQAAMETIAQATGESPVAGALVIQFAKESEGFAGFAIAKMDSLIAMKIIDALWTKFAGEIRAAKVKINTVRKPTET